MTQQLRGEVDELPSRHAAVITRAQALAAGMTRHAIQARLDGGRWQRLHVGVYAVNSGRPTRESLLWAAVLGVRSGGVLCHQTAAELHGLRDVGKGRKIHVMVPSWSMGTSIASSAPTACLGDSASGGRAWAGPQDMKTSATRTTG